MTLNRRASRHSDPSSTGQRGGVASIVTDRRRFIGFLIAAPTLAAAAELGLSAPRSAEAAIPSGPQPPEIYDLNDMLKDAALPTSNLITVPRT
jgi:isoquinoline 1-oxidoreductase subunit beta